MTLYRPLHALIDCFANPVGGLKAAVGLRDIRNSRGIKAMVRSGQDCHTINGHALFQWWAVNTPVGENRYRFTATAAAGHGSSRDLHLAITLAPLREFYVPNLADESLLIAHDNPLDCVHIAQVAAIVDGMSFGR